MRWLVLCFSLLGFAAWGKGVEARPNFLVIVADDLGWGDASWHGSEILMPHLDALAREGVRLKAHYVMATCSPTRAGFLSGRYPSRFGCLSPTNNPVFDAATVTLPAILQANGYFTGLSGKWHLGSRPEWGPRQHGFKASYGALAGGVDQLGHWYKDGPFRRTWHRNDAFCDEAGHATDLFAREAEQWVRQYTEQPWFIMVTHTAPHIPLQESRVWVRPYDGKINDPSRRLFAAAVTHLDQTVGDLVRALEETGQRERTLILFTSDNGGQRNWFGTQQYAGGHLPCPTLGRNLPLRGWKGELFEGGIRVPAFVSWPSRLNSGTVEAPVHVVDWLPTLIGLAQAEIPDGGKLDGRDAWPLLLGHEGDVARTLYWRTPRAAAVRRGAWKLLVGEEQQWLFNLRSDPGETENLASTQPGRVAWLLAALRSIQAEDAVRAVPFN